ncbi:MAG: DUF294 nucleotidyltransferase-like domain-containing protein [Desulfobacteraceae bacterium]|nr:DUF294 nucleotidyltransferase-like domain-containing protein [Desulfobacteraceae bacterium]
MSKTDPSSQAFEFLAGLPVFTSLPDSEVKQLCTLLTQETFARGTLIATQSKTTVSKIYIIKEGLLELFFEQEGEKTLKGTLGGGDIFGGISLLVNHGKSVRTVEARENTIAWTLPGKLFLEICQRYNAFADHFLRAFHERMLDKAYASSFQAGQSVTFLCGILPFSFLPEVELQNLANDLSLTRHAKGTLLFVQGRSIVDRLYILKSGAVERYFEEDGEKKLHVMLGEGEVYGGISMLVNNGLSVRTVRVSEEAEFYTLAKKKFLKLCRQYENFAAYFTDTFGKRMMDRSYAAIIKSTSESGAHPTDFFNLRVRDIYHTQLLTCGSTTTVQEAAAAMSRRGCSSIFIQNTQGECAGVITDSDLRSKVIAAGLDIRRPVAEIMSTPLQTIEAEALVSEALLAMMDANLKHLAVTDDHGQVKGVLTHRDILSAQEQSPFHIIRELSDASGIEEIVRLQAKVPHLIQHMIASGAKSRVTTKLITKISDTILTKLIDSALERLGPAPTPFAFMVMGSEGRMEQTLKTDQDNAIVFADVPEEQFEQVKIYFLRLGLQVCTWLNQAGYSFCEGNIMAQNPKWCQPLSKWKNYFKTWIRVSSPKDLLESAIFFDFRGAYGRLDLVDELRLFLFETIAGWTRFFRDLTVNAQVFKPPIGFFGNFVLESKGEHRHKFNLKSAMTPIVDYARIYSLFHNISETNTQERLYHLSLKRVLKHRDYNELEQAYSYLMQQRLLCQIDSLVKGEVPDNYVNPKKLSRIDQALLKEIFKRIELAQNRINMDFAGGMR